MRTSATPLVVPPLPVVDSMIFVFGSNIAGIHGAGAAKFAVDHYGALDGQGFGLQGRAFAIPTKDENIKSLPRFAVFTFVVHFMSFAQREQGYQFRVTRIGCGLAGFHDDEIAPMFIGAPSNCHFYEEWKPWLPVAQCDLGKSPDTPSRRFR